MPIVKFTPSLKRFFPDLGEQKTENQDLNEILAELDSKFPGLRDYVVDEQGQLRKHVNIFVRGAMISDREQLTDKVGERDEIYIMQALSGG